MRMETKDRTRLPTKFEKEPTESEMMTWREVTETMDATEFTREHAETKGDDRLQNDRVIIKKDMTVPEEEDDITENTEVYGDEEDEVSILEEEVAVSETKSDVNLSSGADGGVLEDALASASFFNGQVRND